MAMALLKLLFIRHGQSYGNREGRMEGWHSTPLTPKGQNQAWCLGQRLAAEVWRPTHIYCSPLQRATETLDAMLAGFNASQPEVAKASLLVAPIALRDDLKEYHNGVLAGLTWEQATIRYPELCQALEQSRDWLPIPGAETLEQGRQRADGFITYLLNQHHNGDRIWVISHHWMMQQLMARLMGCDRTWGFAVSHTALFEWWFDQSRWHSSGQNRLNTELWQLKRFNDCEHCNG